MIFRLRDFIFYPKAIYGFRRFLEESQYWAPEMRRGWVQERLERVLWHAVKNVPYYRKTLGPYESRFNAMVDNLDLRELPILTKEEIRQNYHLLQAENAAQFRPSETHTSGSTGTPTAFLLDGGSNVTHFASIWRVLNWSGYRFGNKFADLTGYVPRNGRLYQYDLRLNCIHLSSFNFKKENIRTYVEKLKKFDPVLIKAYPSAIDLFCRWMKELDLNGYRPKAVLTCAETLLEHQRAAVQEVLQCPVFDFYNQNERAALISTCENARYHVHEEYSYVEFLNPSESAQTADSPKAIVATTLHNFAMPLIRYQTNDLATLGDQERCSCGRTYSTVERIIGRVEDIVVTPDGRYVGRLDAAFKYSPGVRLSQVVQETVDEITVKVVKAASFRQRDVETIERELRTRLGDEIGIRFEYVDAILPGRNGKVKFVISKPGKEALATTS
ncbi:MAG: phenylacetate--CoA ligase family protein [Calditrichaeota bacterium]|nr:MAG: phenylacetate--CoA ligase family protein [Calditrichota bacterium]